MGTKNHSARQHAKLSASGASRWLNCTPSPTLEEEFEEQDSDFAKEGTLAHEFAEITLNRRVGNTTDEEYKALVKGIVGNKLYTNEMPRHVETYVQYIMEQFRVAQKLTPDALLLTEERVDYSAYAPEGFGTCDNIIVAAPVLDVIDLKYGKGVKVDADDNPQLKLYALGALEAYELGYEITTVRMTIVQPRLDHVSIFEMSAEDLILWGETVVMPQAQKAFIGEGVQVTGSWCRWCKAAPTCRALADYNLGLAKHEFAKPMLLDAEELTSVYGQIDLLTTWAKSVKEYMLKEAINGTAYEGYKLVASNPNRKWIDGDTVIDTLLLEGFVEEQIQTVKVKGLGDIQDLMPKDKFDELMLPLIVKPNGQPTLVPESDKRVTYSVSSAKDDFG